MCKPFLLTYVLSNLNKSIIEIWVNCSKKILIFLLLFYMCFIENIVLPVSLFLVFCLLSFIYFCPEQIMISFIFLMTLFVGLIHDIIYNSFLFYFLCFWNFYFRFTFNPINFSLSKYLSEIYAFIYQKQSILFPTNYSTFKIRFRKHDFFISFVFYLNRTKRIECWCILQTYFILLCFVFRAWTCIFVNK